MKIVICLLLLLPVFADAQYPPIKVDSTRGPIIVRSDGQPIIIRTSDTDTVPPSVPTGLTITSIGRTDFSIAWTASTDPFDYVISYYIYIDGTQYGPVTATSYTFTGASPSTTYEVAVSAYNAEFDLESGQSDTISVLTLPNDSSALSTPLFRSETILAHSYYMSWDTVPGAEFYVAYRDTLSNFSTQVQVHKGGGADFLDAVEPSKTYYYRVKAFNKVDSSYLDSDYYVRTIVTATANSYAGNIVSDKVRDVFTIHAGYRVTRAGGTFNSGDIGKIISIKDAAIQPWYSRDTLWLNSIITAVSGDSAVLGQVATGKDRDMGDSLVYALFTTGAGYYGTNAYETLVNDIDYVRTNSLNTLRYSYSDTALIDPFRSLRWWSRSYPTNNSTTDSSGILFADDITIKGLKLLTAWETFAGKQMAAQTAPYGFTNRFFVHKIGTVRLDSSIIAGGESGQPYAQRTSYFYQAMLNANMKRFMFTNSQLEPLTNNYSDGFSVGITASGQQNSGDKSFMYANNSTIECPEPFGGQSHSPDNTYYTGLRVVSIDCDIIGSARPIFVYSDDFTISNDTLTIDSVNNASASQFFNTRFFRSLVGQQLKYIVGGGNTFYDAAVINNYQLRLLTRPVADFTKISTVETAGQPPQVGDGHLVYPSPNVEMYFAGSNISQQYKLIWRYNDDATYSTYQGGAQRYMGYCSIAGTDTATYLFPDWLSMNISSNQGLPANNDPPFFYPKGIDSLKYGYFEYNTGTPLIINGEYTANFYAEGIKYRNLPVVYRINSNNVFRNSGGDFEAASTAFTGYITVRKGNNWAIFNTDSTDYNTRINAPNLNTGGTVHVYGGGAGFVINTISTNEAVQANRDTLTMNFINCVYGTGSFSFSADTQIGMPLFVEGAKYYINSTGGTYDSGRIFSTFPGQSGYKFFWPNPAFWSTNSRCTTFENQTSGWGAFGWCVDD